MQLKMNSNPAFLKLQFLKFCFTKLTALFWKAFLEGLSTTCGKGGDASSASMPSSASSLPKSATGSTGPHKADLCARDTGMSPIRSRYLNRISASWSTVSAEGSSAEAVVWKTQCLACRRIRHQNMFPSHELEKGSEARSVLFSRNWANHKTSVSCSLSLKYLVTCCKELSSTRITQLLWVRLLSWERKCEVYISQRQHWMFIFHTCGNYGAKSTKWASFGQLFEKLVEASMCSLE